MKKWLVLFLLVLCGLSPAHANQPVFVSGTCTNTDHTVVLTDGSASAACAGVDLSPYIGEWLEWFDSTARPIKGFIGDSSGKIYTTAAASVQNWQWKHASFDNNDASGYSYRVIKSQPQGNLVASGTIADASTVHLASVNGGSMLEITGVDLSVYAGGDNATVTVINPFSTTGATWHINKYLITLEDSTGKLASGYMGASPVGAETLSGVELVTNPTFDAVTTGWSIFQGSVASVAGGQSNNCAEVTRTSGTLQSLYQDISTTGKVGYLYKFSAYVKSGTSGNEAFTVQGQDDAGSYTAIKSGVSSGTWTAYSAYYNVRTALSRIQLVKYTSTAGTMLWDTVSIQEVSDISSAGIHLHSSPTATNRNMARFDSGFNPSAVSKYRIYQIGPSGYDPNLILQESGQPIQLEQNSANLQQEG